MMKIRVKIIIIVILNLTLYSCAKTNSQNQSQGISGSTAKMITLNNYLYVIDNLELSTFDISDAANPVEQNKQEVGFGIETIFPFDKYLFLGSNDGLYIYDISNPAIPTQASSSQFQHARACDPVVANEYFAYVTLNSNRLDCGSVTPVNELQIIDIQNIQNPQLVNVIEMQGPKGLAMNDTHLFVCDLNLGVVVLDLSNPIEPVELTTITGFTANDLILEGNNLMVVSTDGLRQFDISDIQNISLTSFLDLHD